MSYVGYGKNNVKLDIGDICTFTINKVKYEGMIMYDEDVFAYVFEMKDDKFPSVYMLKADLDSIEKIINIYSTNMNDEYGFYREIYNKSR
jgi:hypothetical protein